MSKRKKSKRIVVKTKAEYDKAKTTLQVGDIIVCEGEMGEEVVKQRIKQQKERDKRLNTTPPELVPCDEDW